MNDKLKGFAGRPILPPPAGRGSSENKHLVLVSKSDENKGRRIVRVSLHKRAVEKLGWQGKDCIYMEVTPDGDIVMMRDKLRGRELCAASGKAGRMYVRYAVIPEFYDALPTGCGQSVEIENGRIAFSL